MGSCKSAPVGILVGGEHPALSETKARLKRCLINPIPYPMRIPPRDRRVSIRRTGARMPWSTGHHHDAQCRTMVTKRMECLRGESAWWTLWFNALRRWHPFRHHLTVSLPTHPFMQRPRRRCMDGRKPGLTCRCAISLHQRAGSRGYWENGFLSTGSLVGSGSSGAGCSGGRSFAPSCSAACCPVP